MKYSARNPDYLRAMLDQAIQAALTLVECWQERTDLQIGDDPFVEDAVSTIDSLRQELREFDEPSLLDKALAGDKNAAKEVLMEMGVIDAEGNLRGPYAPE
jgi:hypothetical protein